MLKKKERKKALVSKPRYWRSSCGVGSTHTQNCLYRLHPPARSVVWIAQHDVSWQRVLYSSPPFTLSLLYSRGILSLSFFLFLFLFLNTISNLLKNGKPKSKAMLSRVNAVKEGRTSDIREGQRARRVVDVALPFFSCLS